MASSTSFNQTGATPGTGLKLSVTPSGTPQGQALSSLAQTSTPQKGSYTPPNPLASTNGLGSTLNNIQSSQSPQVGSNPGLLPSAPQQPVTKHTATDAAGNTVTQTFAPTNGSDQSSSPATPPAYDTQTGQLTAYGKSIQAPPPSGSAFTNATQNIGTTATTGGNNILNTAFGGADNINTTASQGAQNITNASQPSNQYSDVLKELEQSKAEEGQQLANIGNSGAPLVFQQGRQQNLGNQYLAQQNALSGELSGILGEQTLGQTGATSAAGLTTGAAENAGQLGTTGATSAAGLTTGAAGTQAGLLNPKQNGYVLLDPTTGQPVGGNGAAGNAAFTGGQTNQQEAQGGQYQTDQSNIQAGRNQTQQLNSIISQLGLNPSNVNLVNAGIQAIAKNTSSPQYQILSNYLGGIASSYAPVLGQNAGTLAQSLISETASGQSIQQVINNLDIQAQGISSGHKSAGTTGTTSGSSGSSSSTSGFGWNG